MGNVITPIGGLGTGMRVGWGLYFKNEYDYKNKVFDRLFINVIGVNFLGLDRDGKDMNGRHSAGTTRTIRNNIYINPVTAPPSRKIWLQNIRESYMRMCLFMNKIKSTNRGRIKFKFYKTESLKKIRKNNEIESDYRIRPKG